MATYCKDIDLVKFRPNIMELGVDSWEVQREEAFSIINRIIIARWYIPLSKEKGLDYRITEFESSKVESGQLTRLEVFKTLELAYMLMKKDTHEPDGFSRFEGEFRKRFSEELEMILAVGINYDWDADEVVSSEEKYLNMSRKLVRG